MSGVLNVCCGGVEQYHSICPILGSQNGQCVNNELVLSALKV